MHDPLGRCTAARPPRALRDLALAVALTIGCGGAPPTLYGDPPPNQPSTTADGGDSSGPVTCPDDPALGVPVMDPQDKMLHPSYPERTALYACDRARTDPEVSNRTNWSMMYPAVPPLLWDGDLARASLAHSIDMRDTPCFQHPSCDGTDPFVRIGKFWKKGMTMGENIAAGQNDPQSVVEDGWINEMGAAPGTTGHRDNMFSSMFQWVGFGYAPGGTKFQGYFTQDFGGASTPSPFPMVPVGSHFPQTGSMITFGAVFYDQQGKKAPDKVEVYLDGKASPLMLVRGMPEMGGYEATVAMPKGCHGYRLVATQGGKTVGCYPGKGLIGVGDSVSCPEFMP